MLQHVQSDIIHIFVCLEKGGVCYFSHPDGGGHAILSSRNRGGQHFFSYSEALSATPPPSAEIYEQSLMAVIEKVIINSVNPAGAIYLQYCLLIAMQ